LKTKFIILCSLLFAGVMLQAQNPNKNYTKFKQLHEELPTPNSYRTGAGAPGHKYFQQKADYIIRVELDDENAKLMGTETVTYHNNSPDALNYLWLQLDQNVRAPHADSKLGNPTAINPNYIPQSLGYLKKTTDYDFDGGFNIEKVTNTAGDDLNYTIHKTMMRIDLEEPLRTGENISFNIDFWYNINDRMSIGGRSGYEHFEENDNKLYTIAQFYPRMAVYDDVEGWQNKQFLGQGEFALSFGDYDVKITAPSDHIIGATGTLQNPKEVLTRKQYKRLKRSKKSYDKPMLKILIECFFS